METAWTSETLVSYHTLHCLTTHNTSTWSTVHKIHRALQGVLQLDLHYMLLADCMLPVTS